MLFSTSSIGEKIKKSSEISECFKIMGSQLSFFPYAIRGSMHEAGEFYNQPPSNLHTSLRGRTRGYKGGMKLLSIGSESPHSVFTKIDIKGSTTQENPWE